jgi:hypothetical protein
MNEKSPEFNLETEFFRIQKNIEQNLEILCTDLHSAGLALRNMQTLAEVTVPNPYISYFLKENINSFFEHTKKNKNQIVHRICNGYTLSIISIFELHIKKAYGLMLALRKQKSMSLVGDLLKTHFQCEMEKFRTLGVLVNEVQEKIEKIDPTIIKDENQYYDYFRNYIKLRNCIAHNNGIVSKNEIDMEIRLPVITQDQIHEALSQEKSKIDPQTVLKMWNLNDQIQLEINEVEGIAYGLIKVSFVVIKHHCCPVNFL